MAWGDDKGGIGDVGAAIGLIGYKFIKSQDLRVTIGGLIPSQDRLHPRSKPVLLGSFGAEIGAEQVAVTGLENGLEQGPNLVELGGVG